MAKLRKRMALWLYPQADVLRASDYAKAYRYEDDELVMVLVPAQKKENP